MMLQPSQPFFRCLRVTIRGLQALTERINADDELRQLWRSANVNAVDRMGLEIVVRCMSALWPTPVLNCCGCCASWASASNVTQHRLTADEAEIIVVLAAALHDLGLAVHTDPQLAARAGLVSPIVSWAIPGGFVRAARAGHGAG